MVDRRLPHGYTNSTYLNDRGAVVKRYQGGDAGERAEREARVLRFVAGRLPVPRVLARGAPALTVELTRLEGVHGQDLLDAHGASVMRSLGAAAKEIHRLPLSDSVLTLPGKGSVLVHGDFGPQNCLLSTTGDEVVAILDWEFARIGEPLQDLAWAEWIVRTHHPRQVAQVSEMFETYGRQWAWSDRQAAMLSRCARFVTETRGDSRNVWQARLDATASWNE